MNEALAGLFPEEIAAAYGIAPFQGRQIFQWIHKRRIFSYDAMTDLSKALRARLEALGPAVPLTLLEERRSERTGTRKILLGLCDGETIESVLLRDGDRVTICVSSQAGCALNCAFCATGHAGFVRDLDPAEIAGQTLVLLADEALGDRTPNIVYMGMGEPFRNYDNMAKSIRLLMHPTGAGIGARKITVSTAGDIPGIARFAQEDWQVRLGVSLHAANDTLRDRLVPLNRAYPLDKLRAALQHYQQATGRQFTFEWTLLGGVNDTPRDADELARFIGNLDVSVNVIPWNPAPDLPFSPPEPRAVTTFLACLAQQGINATLRQEKGQDIDAACGQLRRRQA